MCLDFPKKWQTQAGLPCILSLERVDSLGLDFFRSTLIFLDGETSMDLTTSLTGGLTVSLTTSLTEGLEEDEGTKFVEWEQTWRCFQQNLIQICQNEAFEHSAFDQV